MVAEQIAILDFGSQYTHLIARRIRGKNVLAKIYSPDVDPQKLSKMKGIILSGGPQSVEDHDALMCHPDIFQLGVPVLGICYGHQLMAKMLGGAVRAGDHREYGRAVLQIKKTSGLLEGFPDQGTIWMSHGDSVAKLPEGFHVYAGSDSCPVVVMSDPERKFYGLQFHPEVSHTEHGDAILQTFLFSICACEQTWDSSQMLKDVIQDIRKRVGSKNVFLLVSGGVDSVVSLALLDRALGRERVRGLHIDHGLMRENESHDVMRELVMNGFDNVEVINAADVFARALRGVKEPEEKRKRIGRAFLRVKDAALKECGLTSGKWLFAQGTIYPDTVESGGTAEARTIKTHHNRVDEIQRMVKKGQVIEPIADFYKDEVRALGRELNISDGLLNRHPFPGPGLAIRALCSDGGAGLSYSDQRRAQERLDQVIQKYNLIYGGSVRGTILSLRSVGVQGDQRTYLHPVVLDGHLAWGQMLQLASDIVSSLKEVNRVLILCGGSFKDLASANEHVASLTEDRLHLLRLVDNQVEHAIRSADIYDDIWQFPVVLAPFGTTEHTESIVLRPVQSVDAMTAAPYELPDSVMIEVAKSIDSNPQIEFCFYDITQKPPGTIEWE